MSNSVGEGELPQRRDSPYQVNQCNLQFCFRLGENGA